MKDEKATQKKEIIKIELKPYTTKDLAEIYRVSTKTFRKWIRPLKKELGNRTGWFYSIPQVKLIFNELLLPSWIEIEQDNIGKNSA